MAKVLLINPNKWGRGITHIWIASHAGILKRNNHKVELFDATFYSNWSLNEVQFQTDNKMYKKTNYDDFLKFNKNDIHNLLVENLPGEIWNPTDLANTAMALDCITNVPEDFFKRNDRFGMAFSMEGRFPLASKEYMKYCLNIDSSEKFGLGFEGGNKMFVRKAYKDMLPSYVLSKSKTGWSVPVSNWIHQDNPLRDKFIKDQKKESGIDQIFHKENYDISISGKRSIITWMFTNWARQFDMYL